MDALVEIQLPTQPIPFYFFRIIIKKQNKKKSEADVLPFCVPHFVAWMFLFGKKKVLLAGMQDVLLMALL